MIVSVMTLLSDFEHNNNNEVYCFGCVIDCFLAALPPPSYSPIIIACAITMLIYSLSN